MKLWMILLLAMTASAANIPLAETTLEIEGNTLHINSTLNLTTDQTINNITFVLEKESTEFELKINGQKRNCLVQATYARCGTIEQGHNNITYEYTTTYPLAKVGEDNILQYTDRMPYQTDKHNIILKLPLGTIIPKEHGKDETFYITPKPDTVYSDGQRILLAWEKAEQDSTISVVTRNVAIAKVGYLTLTITAIIALAIGYTAAHIRKRKKAIAPEFIEHEKQVVNILKETENKELWQKQLLNETKFSKAKLSRIIRNLEERGVITKTPYGNTNKIKLKTEEETITEEN